MDAFLVGLDARCDRNDRMLQSIRAKSRSSADSRRRAVDIIRREKWRANDKECKSLGRGFFQKAPLINEER